MNYVIDLRKGSAEDVDKPGSQGGKIYTTKNGTLRYGDAPHLTRKVKRIDLVEGDNPYEGFPQIGRLYGVLQAVGGIHGLHDPQKLHAYVLDWFKKQGFDPKAAEAKWQDFINRIHSDKQIQNLELGAQEQAAEEVVPEIEVVGAPSRVMADSGEREENAKGKKVPILAATPIYGDVPKNEQVKTKAPPTAQHTQKKPIGGKAKVVIGTREQHKAQHPPLWKTCDLSKLSVEEAPDYEPIGATLKLKNGTKIKLNAEQEEMARDFAVMRWPSRDTALKHCWSTLVRNFGEDFSAAMGQKIDLMAVNWDDLGYRFKQAAQKKVKKKAKKAKGTGEHGALTFKDDPAQFAIIDGEPQRIGRIVLPAAGMYKGTSGHSEHVGRWRRKIRFADVMANASTLPKGWKGQSINDPTSEFIFRWKNPVSGQTEYKNLHRESSLKQQRMQEGKGASIKEFSEHYETIHKAIEDALNSSDPKEQEIGFLCMLMDTMHARIGNKTETRRDMNAGLKEPVVGASSFLVRHLNEDGSYRFHGKDHVEWDSSFKTTISGTSREVGMNKAAMIGPRYDARPIYRRLTKGKGPNDFIFSVGSDDVNAWLRRVTGADHLHAHNFRHFHGTRYFMAELKHHEPKLMALKKAGKLTQSEYNRVMSQCSEAAAIKLGHRRTVTKEKAAETHQKRAEALKAAKAKAKAAGKKFDEKAFLAKYKTVGVGASTTRKSYLDFEVLLKHTFPRYGLDLRSKTEKRETRGLDLEKRLGIPTEAEAKAAMARNRKKAKKSLIVDLSKAEPEIVPLVTYSPVDEDPVPRPIDGYNTYSSAWWFTDLVNSQTYDGTAMEPGYYVAKALHGGRAEKEGKSPKDFPHKLIVQGAKHEKEHTDDEQTAKQIAADHLAEDRRYYVKLKKIEKAILTKQSAEMKPVKQAPKPSKSSGQFVDPKTGKKRYQYQGQKPNVGNKKPPQTLQEQKEEGPQPLNVEELATALQIPTGTLKQFAKRFSHADKFIRYLKANIKAFLEKHEIGDDKLRRLHKQLTTDNPWPSQRPV